MCIYICRTSFVGICSGMGRIGAIVGIILGEYDMFHFFKPVLVFAGTLSIISAMLIIFLPETTKSKMPETYQEIQMIKIPKKDCECETKLENSCNEVTHM